MDSKPQNIYKVENPKKKTIYDYMEEYLFEKYQIRYNEISQDFQISLKNSNNWEELEVNSILIELAKCNIEVPPNKLEIFLRSYVVPHFNPISKYFEDLEDWDGQDYISKLCSYVPVQDSDSFSYHFKKWLVRTIRCALEESYFNKQCLVLVHNQQNSGKSTWCRFICPPPLSKYIAEDISNDKDARIQLTRNFIINLDELSMLNKKDINSLKAYFSKTFINERLPYDRKNSTLSRTCSFIGSTNQANFLNDETGSVRWLCFKLLRKIDFNYSKEIQVNQIWSQAYHLAYSDPNFSPELTLKDIEENEERNREFRQLSTEEELITKYFEPSQDMKDFYTSSEILAKLSCLNIRLNVVFIGRALNALNFQRVKHPKRQVYGFLTKQLFTSSPWEIT